MERTVPADVDTRRPFHLDGACATGRAVVRDPDRGDVVIAPDFARPLGVAS